MTTMLENGHAENVPNTEKPEKGKVWYKSECVIP